MGDKPFRLWFNSEPVVVHYWVSSVGTQWCMLFGDGGIPYLACEDDA